MESYLEDNPLMIGVLGFVGGLVLGSLLPRTRLENRNLGPWRDEMARRGIRRGREYAHQAREFAEEQMSNASRSIDPDGSRASGPYGGPTDTP